MTRRTVALVVGATLLAAACGGGASLEGSWQVTEIAGQDANLTAPITTLTLEFGSDGIAGSSGCNTFSGPGDWPSENLQLMWTAMACMDDDVMALERLYLDHLAATEEAAIAGDTMTATDSDGNTLLVFTRANS